jgi:hypothetical protein
MALLALGIVEANQGPSAEQDKIYQILIDVNDQEKGPKVIHKLREMHNEPG